MPATGSNSAASLMAQWMGKVGFELQPLADYVLERIKQGERVFADETVAADAWHRAPARSGKAWLWAYARDDRPFGGASPPMVAYRFEDSRGGDCVARHMAGFTGILQVDGYSAYTKLAKAKAGANEAIALAGCWAHLRRRFYELHISGSSQGRDAERHDHGRTLDHRGGDPRPRSGNTRGSPSGPLRRHRRRAVQALGKGTAAHLGKIEAGRGDPLRHVTGGRSSSASSPTAGSKSTPTSSSAPSGPRQSSERTRSSPAAKAADARGRPSPPCCRPPK